MALVLSMSSAFDVSFAYAQTTSQQSARTILFNIPAQPLDSALERYSAVSGAQVIYDGSLAAGHFSTPVNGPFTPASALRRLLTGTGLAPHYTTEDDLFLTPDTAASVRQDSDVNTASHLIVDEYYGHIQASLRRAFCAQVGVRAGGYRVAVSFWVSRSGAISRAALLSSTGSPGLDVTIKRTVQSISVDMPPPVGFAQPVVLIVTPALAQYCQATQDRSEMGGAGQ
ncbi:MAG: TonB family protein [Pseudomonadota bacterium]